MEKSSVISGKFKPWFDGVDSGILREISLGPSRFFSPFCVIHSGLSPPAYPAKAKDPRQPRHTGSLAPSLLRASIAEEDMWLAASS